MAKPKRSPAAVELGERIRARRLALGFSQERLAQRSELSWSYVSSVERGERNVTLHNILRLGHALGVDPPDLIRDLPVPFATVPPPNDRDPSLAG